MSTVAAMAVVFVACPLAGLGQRPPSLTQAAAGTQATETGVAVQGSTVVVTGLVVDRELGTPVAWRSVLLFSQQKDQGHLQDRDGLGPVEFQAETDSDGRFRVDAVPRDRQFWLRLDDLQLLYRQLDARVRGIVGLDTKGLHGGVLDLGTLLAEMPVYDPVAIEGLLLDKYTLEPLASRKVRLDPRRSRYSAYFDLEAVTDLEGRFRFAKVPREGRFLVRIDDDSVLELVGGDGGSYELVTPPTGALFDTGPLAGYAGDALRWAPVCSGESGAPAPARANLLVFEWEGGRWRDLRGSLKWKQPWKAILCLERAFKVVGRYGGMGEGRRVTLEATLVRLSNGKRYRTKITAEPPKTGDILAGEQGDPFPALEAWLATLPH